jgi:adenosylmethionine-8-amino-7-oxononanoate aminotransferase/thioesterase domain-containing protein
VLVHDFTGQLWGLDALVRELRAPCIGIQCTPRLINGCASIHELALRYLRLLQRTPADGAPLRLLAYSFGCRVAYRMTCALHAAARDVRLVLLDGPVGPETDGPRRMGGGAGALAARIRERAAARSRIAASSAPAADSAPSENTREALEALVTRLVLVGDDAIDVAVRLIELPDEESTPAQPVRAPTLLVTAARSDSQTNGTVPTVDRLLPSAQHVAVAGGHFDFLHASAVAVATAISAFELSQPTPAAAAAPLVQLEGAPTPAAERAFMPAWSSDGQPGGSGGADVHAPPPVEAAPALVDFAALRACTSLFPVGVPCTPDERDTQLIVRAEGLYLIDDAGRRILDSSSNMFNVTLGYSCEPVKRAIREQLHTLPYYGVHRASTSPPALQLATALTGLLAEQGMTRAFFTSGGSEAIESSMKMARHYHAVTGAPSKTRFGAFDRCFHGLTYSATALLRDGHESRARLGPFMDSFNVPFPDFYRRDESVPLEEFVDAALRTIADALEAEGPETIAALYADPFSWASGWQAAPPALWQGVRALCDRHGILLIADEIVTGFGRTGKWFGVQHWGVSPDMLALGKGFTAGYFPYGAVVLHGRLEHAFSGKTVLMHGHTNCGHPVGCSAALAVIDYIAGHALVDNVGARGEQLRALLRRLRGHCEIIGDVRGRGLLIAIEFVSDRTSKAPLQPTAFLPIVRVGRTLGLRLRALDGHTLGICPSSIVSDAEVRELVARLATVLIELKRMPTSPPGFVESLRAAPIADSSDSQEALEQ